MAVKLMNRTYFGLLLTASILLSGCGGNPGNNAAPTNSSPAINSSNGSPEDPLGTTKRTPETTANAAPILSPVVKAYCDAWVKNDEAALRKVFSSDTLRSFEADMKVEKAKGLLELLQDDKVSGTPCEASNEAITGDTATAMVKTNKTPNGLKRVFVKENGEWKLTNKVPDLESVKKAAPATNSQSGPSR